MEQKTTSPGSALSTSWERLEGSIREKVQRLIQALLEEGSTNLLGRPKSARRAAVEATQGMRNGYSPAGCV